MNLKCWWSGHDYEWKGQKHVEEYGQKLHYYECSRCGECTFNRSYLGFWDKYGGWFIGLGVLLLIVGVLHLMVYLVSYLPCKSLGTLMELPWKWDYISGCYFEVQDRWIARELLGIVELLK